MIDLSPFSRNSVILQPWSLIGLRLLLNRYKNASTIVGAFFCSLLECEGSLLTTDNTNPKRSYEQFIFQSFLDTLFENKEYRTFIENIQDIKHDDAPDFEVVTKQPLNGRIGIELTNYLLDAKQVEKNGKVITQSDLLISTVKKQRNNELLDTGGFYGIGNEISEIINAKSNCFEKGYRHKSFLEYWLVIHSNNQNPFQFIGDANPRDIFLHKCNRVMKEVTHPFQKVFLFCFENNQEWICELSKKSQFITGKNTR